LFLKIIDFIFIFWLVTIYHIELIEMTFLPAPVFVMICVCMIGCYDLRAHDAACQVML